MDECGSWDERSMCLARGGVGGEWMRGLGLGLTNPVGTEGVFDVCLCLGCGGVGDVGGEWVSGLNQGLEGWGDIYVSCSSGFSV